MSKKIVQFAHVQSNNCQKIHILKNGSLLNFQTIKKTKKRLFVYLSFNLYHFGQMWNLCTIYCFQMYCAMNSGFSEKKTGPQKLMEQIWYSCRVRRDLHLFNATFRATLNTVLPGTYEALFSSCSTSLSQYFIRTLYWCKFCGFAVWPVSNSLTFLTV